MSKQEIIKTTKVISIGLMILMILIIGVISSGYQPVVVISNSMQPLHLTNSIVIVDTNVDYKDLEVGDIILYNHDNHKGIVHKVFQVSRKSNTLLSSGTNNETNPIIDSWVVNEDMYKGKVVKGFNEVAPIITFLFGNLVIKSPLHILFGFSVLTLVFITIVTIILKVQ